MRNAIKTRASGAVTIKREVVRSLELRPANMTGKPLQLRKLNGNEDVPEAKKRDHCDDGVRSLKPEKSTLCE